MSTLAQADDDEDMSGLNPSQREILYRRWWLDRYTIAEIYELGRHLDLSSLPVRNERSPLRGRTGPR